MTMAELVISATVVTEDQNAATRAAEAFSRAATGLALEGINASVTMSTVGDSGDGDD